MIRRRTARELERDVAFATIFGTVMSLALPASRTAWVR